MSVNSTNRHVGLEILVLELRICPRTTSIAKPFGCRCVGHDEPRSLPTIRWQLAVAKQIGSTIAARMIPPPRDHRQYSDDAQCPSSFGSASIFLGTLAMSHSLKNEMVRLTEN